MNDFKFDVSLRIFTEVVSVEEICRHIFIPPKWINVMGEQRKTPDGKVLEGVYKHNYCVFNLDVNFGEELHDVLERYADCFWGERTFFKKVNESGGRSEFFIGWYSLANSGDTFSWNLLKKVGELGIELALDIYGQ